MYYLTLLTSFFFPRQKDFSVSKTVSASLHTLVPGSYSHNFLPISTVRFPKQFKLLKTPPLVHSFNMFSFRRYFSPSRNSQQSCHKTCRWRAVLRQPPPCPHPVLCFQPPLALFSFVFQKPLCLLLDAAEQMLQKYVWNLSLFPDKTQGLGQNSLPALWALIKHTQLWCITLFLLYCFQ